MPPSGYSLNDSLKGNVIRQMRTAAGFFLMSVAVSAQWLNYPTPGIPKKATGAPDLAATAPRTKDGKPDLSGMWEAEKNRTCPPEGCGDMQAPQEFFNIGWKLKGGLPYQPWAADLVKSRKAVGGQDDPAIRCLPLGVVKMHTTPLMRKIVQTPGLIVILNEANASYRQIFTDGRPLPEDPQPSWNGYSTGKWDGDALVVQTNGFRDDTWLDRNGNPLNASAKITERFRRVNYGRLEIDLTVDDPKAYTRPWTVQLNEFIVLNTELLDFICLENEKDVRHMVK